MLLLTALVAGFLNPPVEDVLSSELKRATEHWEQLEKAPYYVAVAVESRATTRISARSGVVNQSTEEVKRYLDVDLRLGTPELDSTHQLRGMSALMHEQRGNRLLPIEENGYALKHALWLELDSQYRQAVEKLVVLEANKSVKAEEESIAPDFELREPVVGNDPVEHEKVPVEEWELLLAQVSLILDSSPLAFESNASFLYEGLDKTFVDTDGAKITQSGNFVRVDLTISSVSPSGDEITVNSQYQKRSIESLPNTDELLQAARDLVKELDDTLKASLGQPYSGPVILKGRASAVFFHEILGHRVEGHRQKLDYEGKTFKEYVDRQILPTWLDVYDDPTLKSYLGEELNGYYKWDDEGVASQRVDLVQDGIFKGFLMGRSPIPGFETSNGHGRRMHGRSPISRMGNTVVEATQSVSMPELRKMLIERVKKQDLEYGIIVEDIEGGFTMTGRFLPNAFAVSAVKVWKVYSDGRPDEQIRGVDLVGTPLVAFSNIVAAGDKPEVFNGMCGAESGWVPVSASAPPLLFDTLEFQLQPKGEDRPPLLPKPMREGGNI